MPKLPSIHRSVILAAAARELAHQIADTQQRDGAEAAGSYADDEEGAEAARAAAEGVLEPEWLRLRALADQSDVDERLRRHVLRDLAISPRLRTAAERYLREQVGRRIGYPRAFTTSVLAITSYGEDWREAPAVYLGAELVEPPGLSSSAAAQYHRVGAQLFA